MSTSRIFSNGKRVSTGTVWKDKFLQVYPVKKEFASHDHWLNTWTKALTITVLTENILTITVLTEHSINVPIATAPSPALSSPPAPAPAPAPPPATTTHDWSYSRELHFTAPPGKYYVGDLCYALQDDVYENVFGGENYSGGLYQKGSSFFLVDRTYAGDGEYVDSSGREYLVDAGIIGICSWDLVDQEDAFYGGQVMTFTHHTHCLFKDGIFNFDDFHENGFTIRT
jgi:hypothetical protein